VNRPASAAAMAAACFAGFLWGTGAQFVTEALQEKLAVNTDRARPSGPGWMEGFGKLRRLRKETQRIQARIDERFEVIEPEDRA
jgi:hypothetical protein